MSRRGQSTIEVVVLFIVIAAALFLMRAYVQRSLMWKLKDGADKIGTPWTYEGDSSHIAYEETTNVVRHTVEDTYSSGKVFTNYLTYNSFQKVTTNVVEVKREDRGELFQNDY